MPYSEAIFYFASPGSVQILPRSEHSAHGRPTGQAVFALLIRDDPFLALFPLRCAIDVPWFSVLIIYEDIEG